MNLKKFIENTPNAHYFKGTGDLDYKKMDQLIDKMLDNSSKRFKDTVVSENFAEIKKQMRSDEKLYDSLREDVNEMYKNGESIEDIATYGDFLDNPFLLL